MDGSSRKGFWGGLFRSSSHRMGSSSSRSSKYQPPRRRSDGEARATASRRGVVGDGQDTAPQDGTTASGNGTEVESVGNRRERPVATTALNGASRDQDLPLVRWPPDGVSRGTELLPKVAQALITTGASSHKGHRRKIAHASEEYYALYSSSSCSLQSNDDGNDNGNGNGVTDAASLTDSMAQLMTMRFLGKAPVVAPWRTLEQPSYAFFHGKRPGTITLNQWVSSASERPPSIALRDPGVMPRKMELHDILQRLAELQNGLEEDDMGLLYRILYKRILRDPDRLRAPHKTLDKQITDLILVLSGPDWIDFSEPKNQVVTRFIFDRSEENEAQYTRFLHQLLLSLELDLRIHSKMHGDWAKQKLLEQVPPSIRWDLALARRWRNHVRIDSVGKIPEEVVLRYKLKKRQVEALKVFADAMKWPNITETLANLMQRNEEGSLDLISSDAFAFFSGLVLPGTTLPFLTMNTLIDLDPDDATNELALLSHMHPHCGFQYRSSYTYWSSSCIVGKVLAPTCRFAAGWIGPARPTSDLGRSQIAWIRTKRPRQRMTPEDAESMGERSEALGPPADAYPVDEYQLVTPGMDGLVDSVRIELLALKPAIAAVNEQNKQEHKSPSTPTPLVSRSFDATLQFAIDGASWPLRLMYDVSFVSAWPCSNGRQHPLFFDYVFESIRVDQLLQKNDWGRVYERGKNPTARTGSKEGGGQLDDDDDADPNEDEKVLVVEAFGVRDNEVLARAWCAHWGLSAVVADVKKTCMACAIREAYAATLTVVILVDDDTCEDNEK